MSYSRRQLYAMGEPLGEDATRREVGGKVIYGSGGSSSSTPANTTQQVTQDLPEWARPYAKESLGKAAALSATPYQAYGGERIAQFTPMQKQAFGRAEGQQVAGQVGFGTGLAGLAGISSFGDQGTAANFMSPYMDAVVQQQMESAQRQADIAGTQRGAQAVRAGAFGGSRQAVENAEAARALASQKGQIQATGLQSAFERAQSQFNQEQATRLNAAQTLGQLGQQQFGQQMDITGQQAQFGGQQRAATQDILGAQYQDFLNQQRAPYDQLAFMTSMIRGTPMGGTTAQYSTAPAPSQFSQLAGLGIAGAGAYGAYQGAQARGSAAGGEVRSYAMGGDVGGISALNQPQMAAMAGRMSDEQLGQAAEMPSITQIAEMTLAAEAQQRADTRARELAQQAMMRQQPQTTVAEEQMQALGGISDLEAPNLENMDEVTAAGGGIVAFSPGGSTSQFMQDVAQIPERFDAMKKRAREEDARKAAEAKRMRDYREAKLAAQQKTSFANYLFGSPERETEGKTELQTLAAQTPARPTPTPTPAATAAASDMSRELSKFQGKGPALSGISAAIPPAAVVAQGKPDTEKPAPTGTGTGAPLPGLSALQAQTAAGMSDLKGQLEGINAARTAAAANQLERGKAQEAELGEFGTEQEKRLKAREEGLKGSEDKNFNMALIEAGLAMMAGTSANAFENIGKGALVGTKAYTTGMERIQSRKEKLDDALTALENAKRGDKRVSQERMERLQANVDNAAVANADAIYKFGKDKLDMTRQDAEFITEMAMEQRKLDTSVKIAGISAAGRGSADKPFNYQTAYQNYLNNNLGKKDAFNKDIPVLSYADYVQKYGLKMTDDSSGRRVRQLPE